jgi:hypothetical protein
MSPVSNVGMVQELISTAIFVSAGASILYPLLKQMWVGPAPFGALPGIAAFTGIASFLFAGILVWFNARLGYCLGIFAGMAIIPWLILTEELSFSRTATSWILLDGPDGVFPEAAKVMLLGQLRILSTFLIVLAIGRASLPLLPPRFLLGGHALNEQTWPALVVSVLVLLTWFIHSAIPYRIPMFVRGGGPDLRIIHVEKRGLRITEAEASVSRDRKVYLSRHDRRLFQYRFRTVSSVGTASQALYERVRAFAQSPGLLKAHTSPTNALHSWNGEGWYVVLDGAPALAFITENQATPPREVVDLFEEMQKVPSIQAWPGAVKDVCLGFCYSVIQPPEPKGSGR